MTKALITGIAGFAGGHLAEHLLEDGWEVAGLDRGGASLASLEKVGVRISVEECDIVNAGGVARVLETLKPDVVFHLAATSFVPSAEEAPQTAFDINVKGSLNILEGCHRHIPRARIVLISSATVYGAVPPEKMPLTEDHPASPMNFYTLTKLCAEDLSRYYHRVHALPVVILRPFNHIGPRQSRSFVTSSFAFQIAEIEAGKRAPVLNVGNLDAARDFTDVRDMVRAYRLAAEKCGAGQVYNICSGRAHTIREILQRMLRLTRARIEISEDAQRLRKSDIPLLYGDYSRFMGATGWKPEHDIDATIGEILDYWRDEVHLTL
jgi:GDP-4-dehydro-6-deoxy-D-mannose reductase